MYDQADPSSGEDRDTDTTCDFGNECTSMPSTSDIVLKEVPPIAVVAKDDVMTVSVVSKTILVSDSFNSLPLNADIKDFVEPCLTADCISEASALYSSNKMTDSFLLCSPLVHTCRWASSF